MTARRLLLADDVHRQAGHELTKAALSDAERKEILGSNGAPTDHGHAQTAQHFGYGIFVPDDADARSARLAQKTPGQ